MNGAACDQRIHLRRKRAKQATGEKDGHGGKNDGFAAPDVRYGTPHGGDSGVGEDEGGADPDVAGDGLERRHDVRNRGCGDGDV